MVRLGEDFDREEILEEDPGLKDRADLEVIERCQEDPSLGAKTELNIGLGRRSDLEEAEWREKAARAVDFNRNPDPTETDAVRRIARSRLARAVIAAREKDKLLRRA